MKLISHAFITAIILLLMPNLNFAQAPNLGAAQSFAVFTAVGAFENNGTTVITGDIGSNIGAFAGFPPGVVFGQIHVADAVSAQAAIDVPIAYSFLAGQTCGAVIGTTLGNGQTLTPNIYCTGAATTLNGSLTLDAQGDPDAVFIFQIDGALATSTFASVTLINSASLCNVYWQVNGQFDLGDFSTFQGTLLVNGAINLLEGSTLIGRALSQTGAVSLFSNTITIGLPAVAAVISANGPTSFCIGGSVTLSGNVDGTWNTGETTPSITVTTSGDYFVTNTTVCGSAESNHITVTVNSLPVCTITGNLAICQGQTTELCAPAGLAGYSWSTGATTACITVSTAGLYGVETTGANGCTSTCEVTVAVNQLPVCNITGNLLLCQGGTTELCVPVGAASYLWSSGAMTNCITVSLPGVYSVVITGANGCTSTCEVEVVPDLAPPIVINCPADVTIDCNESTLPLNTGTATASDNCNLPATITFDDVILQGVCPQEYSISRTWTATYGNGSIIRCIQTITVEDNTPPAIVCPADVTLSCTESTAPAATGMATATDVCDASPVITFFDVTTAGNCPQEYTILRTWTATDACGNSGICVQTLFIEDNTPPTIVCPQSIVVACAGQIPPVNTALVAASDNCGGTVTITHVGDVISGQTCENRYTITRTYRATDACGNMVLCTQVITVLDETAPTITCLANVTVQCADQIPPANTTLVVASDNCGGTVTVIHVGDVISNQTCENRLTVTRTYRATDACGNTTTCTQIITVFDNTAPVLAFSGAPFTNGDTIRVQCYGQDPDWDLPSFGAGNITATDFCGGEVSVVFNQVLLDEGNCREDGYINLYRLLWIATDVCGNSTGAFVFMALVDTIPPVLYGVPGDITVNCNDPMPAVPFEIYALDECLCACTIIFKQSDPAPGCLNGQVIVRSWTAKDRCGNITVATQLITLVDDVAPLLFGVPDTICMDDPFLNDITAFDYCGSALIRYTDSYVPNPCGSAPAIQRIYEAYDECGNTTRDTTVLLPGGASSDMVFINPLLAALGPNEPLVMDCAMLNSQFSAGDVRLDDPCLSGGNPITFTERVIDSLDCSAGGIAAVVELRWSFTDICGNASSRTVIAHIMDESTPVFVNFVPEVTIQCNDPMPEIFVADDCGEVLVTTVDSIIPGDCACVYTVMRFITATDPCANTATTMQIIHVRNDTGPVIAGVEDGICDDLSIPAVTAYDFSAGAFVPVTMQEDTLTTLCPGGMVIQRTRTAVGSCGNVTTVIQQIIINDQTPPEFSIPTNSVLHPFIGNGRNLILMSQSPFLINRLNALNANSVSVRDDCDEHIIPVFTVEITPADDCVLDGYAERRIYTWIATDICGNADTLTIVIDIMDDVAPAFSFGFSGVPGDITIVCEPLPPAPVVNVIDPAQPVTVTYAEVIQPGSGVGVYIVTRTWVATDACGNTATHVQHITWIPDTFITCEIVTPTPMECNSHGVVITSAVTGGIGPFTYVWEIFGQECFIQGGQGTPQIEIYVGWSTVKVILTVTDAFGCVSMCMITLPCVESVLSPVVLPIRVTLGGSSNYTAPPATTPVVENRPAAYLKILNLWPNPAGALMNVSYESTEAADVQLRLVNTLGQVVLMEEVSAQKGLNTHELNVSKVRQGSYLVQIITEQEVHTKVVVIIRND